MHRKIDQKLCNLQSRRRAVGIEFVIEVTRPFRIRCTQCGLEISLELGTAADGTGGERTFE